MISVSPRRALLALGLGIAIGVKRYYTNPRTMATTLAPAIALSHGGGMFMLFHSLSAAMTGTWNIRS